jgi:transcriptional regulator with XRE-family HTH domain
MDFWYSAQMLDAFDARHMGRVILAYRAHPFHDKPLSQLRVCEWLGLTQAQLSRIEASGDGPSDLRKLIRYAQLFGMPPELLWFKLPQDRKAVALARTGSPGDDDSRPVVSEDGPVDRRKFMSASAGAGFAAVAVPALDLLASLGHAPVPTEVRQSDIDQVRASARLFTSWDHTYGGGVVREAVTAQLRWSAELLEAKCPKDMRPELFAAVGALSGVWRVRLHGIRRLRP